MMAQAVSFTLLHMTRVSATVGVHPKTKRSMLAAAKCTIRSRDACHRGKSRDAAQASWMRHARAMTRVFAPNLQRYPATGECARLQDMHEPPSAPQELIPHGTAHGHGEGDDEPSRPWTACPWDPEYPLPDSGPTACPYHEHVAIRVGQLEQQGPMAAAAKPVKVQVLDHAARREQNHAAARDVDAQLRRPNDAPHQHVIKCGHKAWPLQHRPAAGVHRDERCFFLEGAVCPCEIPIQSRC